MYVDDVELYSIVKTNDDSLLLHDALNKLQDWSHTWQLSVSYNKCMVLELSNENNLSCDYTLNDISISKASACKYLGVTIDHKVSFTQHINVTVSRAHARASLIHKCLLSRDRATLVRAFITYVRPTLEYASSVWSPYHVTNGRKIEAVQRRSTKRLPGHAAFNYSTRLAILELDSLDLRRLRLDLVFAYKLIFGLLDAGSFILTRCVSH
jgi:hypothetical protein